MIAEQMGRMKKIIGIGYLLFLVCFFFGFFYLLFTFRLSIEKEQYPEGYRIAEAQFIGEKTDVSAPLGKKFIYEVPVEGVKGSYRHLIFLSVHQNVKVYADGYCIYEMKVSPHNMISRSPGCVWNDVSLVEKYEKVQVEMMPVYQAALRTQPEFFLGTRYNIVKDILKTEVPGVVISLLGIIMGLIFIGYVLLNWKNSEVDKGISMLGVFALSIGAWKLSDEQLLKLIFPRYPAISLLPFIALILAIVPYTFYLKELQIHKEKFLWYFVCWLSIVQAMICYVLQVTGVMEFRQTFHSTVLLIGIAFVVSVVMILGEIRNAAKNDRYKRSLLGLGICALGVTYDLRVYYLSGWTKTSLIGILIFVFYIFTQAYFSLKEAKDLAAIGRQSQNFETMAYHDQLTGLFNRSALNEDLEGNMQTLESTIVFVFDLNDLKKFNDMLGHEKGDVYIRESALILQNIFGEIGKCYRIGGDEFVCVSSGISLEECKRCLDRLHQAVENNNSRNTELNIAIACGYAKFDRRIDYDLSDTMKRADANMYKDKARLKEMQLWR